jgi:cytochrome c553
MIDMNPYASALRAMGPPCAPAAVLACAAGLLLAVAAGQAAAETASAQDPTVVAKAFEQQVKPVLAGYCLGCHNAEKHKGDLDLSAYATGAAALAKREVWKECAAKLHQREMPPEKERKQPSDAERGQVEAWVRSLRQLSPKDPGRGVIRRLSQVEYANTLHDLLGVDPKVADQLPQDVVGEGFNSSISPLLMEKYLLVADEVLDQLIKPEQLTVKWSAGQLDAVVAGKREEGRPDGAERRFTGPGELLAVISAPVDGTYTIRLRAAAEKTASREPARLAVRVDGQVLGELKITAAPKTPAVYALTCKLAAGRARLSVLMANPYVEAAADARKPAAPSPPAPAKPGAKPADTAKPAEPAKPGAPADQQQPLRTAIIDSIEVVGPPGAPPSEAQRRLLVATPGKDLGKRDAAKRIAEAFARRAYRRPAAPDEIETLLKVFDLADGQDEVFSESVKLMLKAVLVSPAFLYLTPDEGPPAGGGEIVALGPHQLASRLSYLFWATMPDDELAALADAGTLRDPAVIARQVRRLIADPRSHALFDGFGAPWLWLDRLDDLPVDQKKFALMTKEMRKAMRDEPALLFDTILREDRSLLELVDCDYTFVNATLARIYGLEGVKGAQLTRVQLTDGNRGGVLTMPGVLAVTSMPTRTSPVKRGRWVLEQILGQAAPTPPANVPALEKQDTDANAGLSLRQRTERHRADPACSGCHRTLDPLGFGLENFDAIGRWRDKDDAGAPVDASGELPGRQAFRSPRDLKRLLAARPDDFCRALVAKILGYALCRHPEGYDEVVVDEIAAAVAKDGYRFQTLWVKVATSYPFLNRRIAR